MLRRVAGYAAAKAQVVPSSWRFRTCGLCRSAPLTCPRPWLIEFVYLFDARSSGGSKLQPGASLRMRSTPGPCRRRSVPQSCCYGPTHGPDPQGPTAQVRRRNHSHRSFTHQSSWPDMIVRSLRPLVHTLGRLGWSRRFAAVLNSLRRPLHRSGCLSTESSVAACDRRRGRRRARSWWGGSKGPRRAESRTRKSPLSLRDGNCQTAACRCT
jgi:hypothetical protein